MAKKQLQLASIITKLEAGKSQMKIGDWREAERLLCTYEAALRLKSYMNGNAFGKIQQQSAFKQLEKRVRKLFDQGLKRIEKAEKKAKK